jgi:hypothetical protein
MLIDLEEQNLGIERGRWHPEPRGRAARARDTASTLTQCFLDDRSLVVGDGRRQASDLRRRDNRVFAEISLIDRQRIAFTSNDGPLDDVLKFSNISRPGVLLQNPERIGINASDGLPKRAGEALDKKVSQGGNIFPPIAQRRNFQWKDIQPIKEVTPEFALQDRGVEVPMRSRYDPDIDADHFRSTDSFKFTLLKDTKKRDLNFGRDLPYLIEKNGPTLGGFKTAEPPVKCAGEGALFVAEQFGSDQRGGNGSAIDRLERAGRSLRGIVNGAGEKFLSSASLSRDQDSGVCRSYHRDPREEFLESRGISNNLPARTSVALASASRSLMRRPSRFDQRFVPSPFVVKRRAAQST